MWAKTGGTMQYENTLVNGGNGGEYGDMIFFLKNNVTTMAAIFTHCATASLAKL
jgi:hypothetical protein